MSAALQDGFVPEIYRVTARRRELRDAVTLDLAAESGAARRFLPGQFNMLYAFGVGEIAVSISGDPLHPGRLVHTIRDVGAVSGALAAQAKGAQIGVRGPYGAAWPVREAEGADVVFIAGGLGLAPLRPAIYHVLAHRALYGRVTLLYGARAPADLLYRGEFEQWRKRLDVDVAVTVDHADADWRGNVGVVPRLIGRANFAPDSTVAMICGPEVMMRFSAMALHEAGLDHDKIWVSMERNMKCAIGLCGHCQFGPHFICKDGPVMRYDRIAAALTTREL